MTLRLHAPEFRVGRLPGNVDPYPWLTQPSPLTWVAWERDGWTVVCPQHAGDDGMSEHRCQWVSGWRCMEIDGALDFQQVGIIARLASLLAAAEVPIFVLSGFSTDYVLIANDNISRAVAALQAAGHLVIGETHLNT